MTPADAPQYQIAHLREALATDPRTAELGIHVAIRGEHIFLDGEVASEECRRAVEAVATEHVPPPHVVHNQVQVVEIRGPATHEDLT